MTNLIESHDFTSPLAVPDDLTDDVTAWAAGAGLGPINPSIQGLASRTEYLRDRADQSQTLLAKMAGRIVRPTLRAFGGLTVGPFTALVPDAGAPNGFSVVSTTTPTTLTGANLDAGALTAETWYFAYVSAGPTFQISATAPDAFGRYKSTDPTQVYLGCFRENALVNGAIPATAVNGIYRWDEPQPIQSGLNATAWTAVDLSTRIPTTAPLVALLVTAQNTSQGTKTASIRPHGSVVNTTPQITIMAACAVDLTPNYANGVSMFSGEIGAISDQIDYEVSNAAVSLAVAVLGFQEP